MKIVYQTEAYIDVAVGHSLIRFYDDGSATIRVGRKTASFTTKEFDEIVQLRIDKMTLADSLARLSRDR